MKLIKSLALACACIFAIAPATAAEESYAPEAKEVALELQFNPFSNNFSTFKMDQVKLRYYLTDKDALRFGIGFGVNTSKNTPDPDFEANKWTKTTGSNFSIDLGYERNFFNYKRINLYAGAGLGFDYNRNVEKTSENISNNYFDQFVQTTKISSDWGFYAKALTGIDFFVYKGLFVGAEINLKIGVNKNIPTYTKGGSSAIKYPKGPSTTDFVLGLNAEPAIRLGWKF